MTIPDFQTLMLPVLESSKDGEASIGDVVEQLANAFALSDEERATLLPSGRQTTFANRTHWAKSYLGKAGLIEAVGRGRFKVTQLGKDVLAGRPERIDIKFLNQFPTFRTFHGKNDEVESAIIGSNNQRGDETNPLTPDETMRGRIRRSKPS
jgi:restriction system protein